MMHCFPVLLWDAPTVDRSRLVERPVPRMYVLFALEGKGLDQNIHSLKLSSGSQTVDEAAKVEVSATSQVVEESCNLVRAWVVFLMNEKKRK